jgi:predicted membrane-bound mannosyltransferase
VYAQTSVDVVDLAKTVEALIHASPEGAQTLIKVMAPEDDYWPLPWYLRRCKNVGYWSKVPDLPDDPYAPIIIISPALQQPLEEARAHRMGFYGLRPRVRLALFVEPGLWEKWLSKAGGD